MRKRLAGQRTGPVLPSQGLPTVQQIVAIARTGGISPKQWTTIAAAVELEPEEVARQLARDRDGIPKSSCSDPIVSALRRMAWPSDRLPCRHRLALAGLGAEPLAFPKLCLEEARTASWRRFTADKISMVAAWMTRRRTAEKNPEWDQLVLTARIYETLLIVRFGEEAACRAALRRVTVGISTTPEPGLVAEALLAWGLLHARSGEDDDSRSTFDRAAAFLNALEAPETAELRLLLELCRGWASLALGHEAAEAERIFAAALELETAEADPWLHLLLAHEAALAVVAQAQQRIDPKVAFDMAEILPTLGAGPAPELFQMVRGRWTAHQMAEAPTLARALGYLAAAEPLFRELATPELSIDHGYVWAHALASDEPFQALKHLAQAIELALQHGQPEMAQLMATDSACLLFRLDPFLLPPDAEAVLSRVSRLIQASRSS